MAFIRVQGNKIQILHSKRQGAKVTQVKLHVFEMVTDAVQTVENDKIWSAFCNSLEINNNIKSSINRKKLKQDMEKAIKKVKPVANKDPLKESVEKIMLLLQGFNGPLSPSQRLSIHTSKDDLKNLYNIIDEKLDLLKEKELALTENTNYTKDYNSEWNQSPDEDFFIKGLEYHDIGEWEKAKKAYEKGLEINPEHVDLLVHAGLIEFVYEHYHLALSYFDKALKFGKQVIDKEIELNSDIYIKEEDFDKWVKNQEWKLTEECLNCYSKHCEECDNVPENQFTGLYSYHEFRPFFRAMTHKALVLMKLSQYEDAIEILLLQQTYQNTVGTNNMIGECYLYLNNLETADELYNEMLWPVAYYIKSLIKFALNQKQESLKYLLTGITQNRHIGNMLIGREKPEKIRYSGPALPDKLRASEFIHENGTLFNKYSGFKVMINSILDDAKINELLDEITKAYDRRRNEPGYNVDKYLRGLKNGNINNRFLSEHFQRIWDKINDKSNNFWMPEVNEVLVIKILKKNSKNWLVCNKERPENEFYFRPTFYDEEPNDNDIVMICNKKSWYYKKRLYISGEVEQIIS